MIAGPGPVAIPPQLVAMQPSSPFSIPQAPVEPANVGEPTGALFSGAQIGLATFLGTPLAGGILWRANLVRIGHARPWLPVVVAAAALVLLIVAGFLLPRLPSGPVNIGVAVGLTQWARLVFPEALVQRAGRRRWWTAVGIAVAVLIPLVVTLVAGMFAIELAAPGTFPDVE